MKRIRNTNDRLVDVIVFFPHKKYKIDILNDESLDKMIGHDDAFKFLKTIPSSPAFWQQKQKELVSMIRQLGCPTFFLTLSAAETKWPELLRILKRFWMKLLKTSLSRRLLSKYTH